MGNQRLESGVKEVMHVTSPPRAAIALLGLALALSACGAEGVTSDPTTSTSQTGDTPGSTSTTPVGDDMDLVDQARADLAAHLRVSESDIELISIEEVTWPDGSLGCPEPGKSYTQALVEGHRIVLGYGERAYVYHSGGDQDPFLCPSPDSKDGGYEFIPPPGDDSK